MKYILINQNYEIKNAINNHGTEFSNEFSMSMAQTLITAFAVTNTNCCYLPPYSQHLCSQHAHGVHNTCHTIYQQIDPLISVLKDSGANIT